MLFEGISFSLLLAAILLGIVKPFVHFLQRALLRTFLSAEHEMYPAHSVLRHTLKLLS